MNPINNQPTQSAHPLRRWLIAAIGLGLLIVAFLGMRNPELFQARITESSRPSVQTDWYTPNYTAGIGEAGQIELISNRNFTNITSIQFNLVTNPALITVTGAARVNPAVNQPVFSNNRGQVQVSLTPIGGGYNLARGDVIMRLNVALPSGGTSGNALVNATASGVIVTSTGGTTASGGNQLQTTNTTVTVGQMTVQQSPTSTVGNPTFGGGAPTIGGGSPSFGGTTTPILTVPTIGGGTCNTNADCSNNGICNSGTCTCDTGYAGTICDQCANGYVQDSQGNCSQPPTNTTTTPTPTAAATTTYEPQTNVTLFTNGGAVKANATEHIYIPDYQVQPGATGGIELRAGTNMNVQVMDLFVTFPSQDMTITSYQIPVNSPLYGLNIEANPTQTAGRYRLLFVDPNRTSSTNYSFTARTINDNDVLVRLGVSINANAVVSSTPLSVSLARGNGATLESVYIDGVTQSQIIPTVNPGVITVVTAQAQVGGACQDDTDCNGNGNCVNVTTTSPGVCACNIGYQGDLYCQSCSAGYVDDGTGTCIPQLPNFCDQNTCQNNGICNRALGTPSTIYAGGACECPTGYAGSFCQQCAPGYSGYPNCTFDQFANLRNLVLTLDRTEVNGLSVTQNEQLMSSVVVMIHSNAVEGHTFNIEGRQITIPQTAASTPASIASQLVNDINNTNFQLAGVVQATLNPTIPGALIIRALPQGNPNRFVDITTTAPETVVSVFPSNFQSITLQSDDSVGVNVIGEFNDGSTRVLNIQSVTWQAQPVNRVDDAALNGGRLERGDTDGNSTVFAQITQANGNIITSNSLSILVQQAPVVEFARRIGSNPIQRGSRIQLSVRITDLTQLSDIAQINSSIVRSQFTDYTNIQNDPNAVYFTMAPFSVSTLQGVNNGSVDTQSNNQFFRTFTIPVDVPQDARLTDGNYQLILSITNVDGVTSNVVIPITIGAVSTGDVDGNGRLTMLDVILAFQIANGQLTPTPAQSQAANVDGRGNVTILDVILLFNQVNTAN